jgi:tRNA threonylcarbamoyladenosine biosynthesis protein TsaE
MDRVGRVIHSNSQEETIGCGKKLARDVSSGSIICLFGELGAGKTTFIKGVVSELSGVEPEQVCSPTFSYLNIYEGKCAVYHFDLYRLSGADDFLSLGFEEYLNSTGVCCIEWSERILPILPKDTLHVTLSHNGEGRRRISIA